MRHCHLFFSALLELIYPEHCIRCGAVRGAAPWFSRGARLQGLRPWDGTHLCSECFSRARQQEPARRVLVLEKGQSVPVLSAQWTNSNLVDIVGAFKYQGVRGLVWPLTGLWTEECGLREFVTPDTVWVPVPLHNRRKRERGFNQAGMLADQLAWNYGGTLRDDLVVRKRFTGQQAKLASEQDRIRNMQGVFAKNRAFEGKSAVFSGKIIVVDDIVTSGATAGALVVFLRSCGLQVRAVVSLGLAKPDSA